MRSIIDKKLEKKTWYHMSPWRTSIILAKYYLEHSSIWKNTSSLFWLIFHSHICRREFTVPSLFPLFASNTDFMTSLSIFGNISSIWKENIGIPYVTLLLLLPPQPLTFLHKDEVSHDKTLFCWFLSSHNQQNITAESKRFW